MNRRSERREVPVWLHTRDEFFEWKIVPQHHADTAPAPRRDMSALPPKTDIHQQLLDHLVGADEERGRHSQTKLLGRFGIDYQFKLRCLHHRQVGGFLSLENAADIQAGLTV